jgi:hypothetical protein
MRTWRVGIIVALLLLCRSTPVRAETGGARVELSWLAPSTCPDSQLFVVAIERFLDQPLAEARAQRIEIDARIQGDPVGGFAGKVSFVGEQGRSERFLEHTDCTKLTEAMALLAAIVIDPERARLREEAPPSNTLLPLDQAPAIPPVVVVGQGVTSKPSVAPGEVPVVPTPKVTPHGLSSGVAVFGLVGAGMLPSIAPGVSLELQAKLDWVEAAVVARLWSTRSAFVPGTPAASVNLSLMTAGLRLCGIPSRGAWSLHVCGCADVGRIRGEGEQVDNARNRSDWVTGLGGSLGLSYDVGRWSPRLGAELLGVPRRPRFGVLRGGEGVEAFRAEALQVTGFIGLAYQL